MVTFGISIALGLLSHKAPIESNILARYVRIGADRVIWVVMVLPCHLQPLPSITMFMGGCGYLPQIRLSGCAASRLRAKSSAKASGTGAEVTSLT